MLGRRLFEWLTFGISCWRILAGTNTSGSDAFSLPVRALSDDVMDEMLGISEATDAAGITTNWPELTLCSSKACACPIGTCTGLTADEDDARLC